MEYPLRDALAVGVNVWDPHNARIRPALRHRRRMGRAIAPQPLQTHIRSRPRNRPQHPRRHELHLPLAPLSVFFRLGANYNFLYNSNPDYSFFAGLRYGFAPFSFAVDNVTLDNPYWQRASHLNIPRSA